ncbi:MAG: hypothetical protein JW995_01945 [Melioribacteraceae bacterium]|nr:hypothetical protein [Melioribacteraceae bacterium]
MKRLSLTFFLVFSLILNAQVRSGNATVELISDFKTISAGQTFKAALRILHDEHWHTYWRNPGDTGLETRFKWELPAGFIAGEIEWPYPELIMVGDLANYGYEGELLLPVTISAPNNLKSGLVADLKLEASWLICKEECVPGSAELVLSLPVGESPVKNEKWGDAFNQAAEKLPAENHPWRAKIISRDKSSITILLNSTKGINDKVIGIRFFPYTGGFISNSTFQEISEAENGYRIKIGLEKFISNEPEKLGGIFVCSNSWTKGNNVKAIEVSIPIK